MPKKPKPIQAKIKELVENYPLIEISDVEEGFNQKPPEIIFNDVKKLPKKMSRYERDNHFAALGAIAALKWALR